MPSQLDTLEKKLAAITRKVRKARPGRPGENRQAKHQRAESERLRDIGTVPAVQDPQRRDDCRENLQLYCETYHRELYQHAWSDDHIMAISRLSQAVLQGGQFAFAMPRASGKTTLCLTASLWALLYAHRRFVVLIGAEAGAALELLENIRIELVNNDRLLHDFPEAVYPIRELGGIAHRCNGQTVNGERTQMTWTNDRVSFPTVAGSESAGAVLRVAGLTGRLRGMISKTPGGQSIRPDLVIVDDPQTDESARSASQNDTREGLLSGAILGLAGPGETIAAVMPCTIIRHNDMAQRILNRDTHPEWMGEKTKLVYDWPTSKKWDEYCDIWAGDLRNNGTGAAATEFYAENRTAMDAGSKVAWAARFGDGELSAIQHAFNLRMRIGDEAFQAEYQNDPDDAYESSKPFAFSSAGISSKISQVDRGIVPAEFGRLTSFVDLSNKCLWWMLVAFDEHFGGTVMDYGTWPDQGVRYVRLSAVTKTLQRRYQGVGIEAAILRGLEDLISHISQAWPGETGGEYHAERILIDEGDGEHTAIVRNFCRRSVLSAILWPAKGRGIRASTRSLCEGRPREGERFGHFWKFVRNRDRSATVHVDANYWKTFAARRLDAAADDTASINLYRGTPRHHQSLADQLTAEVPREIQDVTTGNTVIEWKQKPNRDNHFLDCFSGCCVGASMAGISLVGQDPVEPAAKARKSARRSASYF